MKKKILSLAVATGLVGAASVAQAQMHINDKGLGEALIYPFYSAANGNDTYVHVVNTTDDTKAVKVRFIEAMNSREVLDFNLYLSPEDVWAGVITADPNGNGAMIRTVDNSCTVPQLGTARGSVTEMDNGDMRRDEPFVNFGYTNDEDDSIERTLEGYIEVIEMGQMSPAGSSGSPTPGWAAVHDTNGVPNSCSLLTNFWSSVGGTDGPWTVGEADEGFVPTWNGEGTAGGLYGFGVVINVPQGRATGYDAVAIDDFVADGDPILHENPGDEFPNLNDGQDSATIFDGVTPLTMTFTQADGGSADAVSSLLMSSRIMNDYVVDPAINATTDWVVAMPTKRFYVNVGTQYADVPFNSPWDTELNQACEYIAFDFWDREEAVEISTTGPVFSPRPTQQTGSDLTLCREVSLISFAGSDSALNGSGKILHGIDPGYNEGWASLSFEPSDLNSASRANLQTGARQLESDGGDILSGLPVTGFAVFSYQNGQLEGGVLSNYSASSKHKQEINIAD